MRGLISFILVCFLGVTPSFGFVEKLIPNHPNQGGIPCFSFKGALLWYIVPGGPAPAVLSSIVQREWVPSGWSAQDIADNNNMIAMLDAQANWQAKRMIIDMLEVSCVYWEQGVDEFDSPAEFRLRMGLPAALP